MPPKILTSYTVWKVFRSSAELASTAIPGHASTTTRTRISAAQFFTSLTRPSLHHWQDSQTSNFGENSDRLSSSAGKYSDDPVEWVLEWLSGSVPEYEMSPGDMILSLGISRSTVWCPSTQPGSKERREISPGAIVGCNAISGPTGGRGRLLLKII